MFYWRLLKFRQRILILSPIPVWSTSLISTLAIKILWKWSVGVHELKRPIAFWVIWPCTHLTKLIQAEWSESKKNVSTGESCEKVEKSGSAPRAMSVGIFVLLAIFTESEYFWSRFFSMKKSTWDLVVAGLRCSFIIAHFVTINVSGSSVFSVFLTDFTFLSVRPFEDVWE